MVNRNDYHSYDLIFIIKSELVFDNPSKASGSDYLKNANRILDKLKRRKQMDNIIFMACLSFFIATCVYILLKRFTPMFLINSVLYFIPSGVTGWFDALITPDDSGHSEL